MRRSGSLMKRKKVKFGVPFRTQSVQKIFVFITLCTSCFLLFLIYEEKWMQELTTGGVRGSHGTWDSGQGLQINQYKNYFLNAARLKELGLVVNTSHCKITDFNPWDEEIIPLIKAAEPVEDCLKTNYNWSRMDRDVLVINVETMNEDGYPFLDDESCCYKIITRENGPALVQSKQADNTISYSSCIPITQERTKIFSPFIMVECSWSRLTQVHYRGFHGVATSQNNARENIIQQKVDYWEKKRASEAKSKNDKHNDEPQPPNILVVGIDSTSRINFRRNMFKTQKFLQNLGAIEMFGYTKVGENTFPNYCPMFNGYSEEEIVQLCLPTYMTYQDDCPLIWKQFDAAKYLTAQTEDGPDFTGFNYRKAGFVKQPVDFYVRPMFLAALDYGLPYTLNLIRSEHLDCISYQTNDEAITTYLESTLDFAHENKAPIFSFSWSTTLAHDNFNMIQLVDETYADFLTRLEIKGYLNNTILFFMGDHGYRFGSVRETLIGYYEDKLPNLWIWLPPRIKEKYPHWQESLEMNSRRLTSPYHYYWTLQKIIQTFSDDLSNSQPEPAKDPATGELIVRSYRQNFLEPVPESNSCSDVGVPDRYCGCYPVESLSLSDAYLEESAKRAVQKINYDLDNSNGLESNVCANLMVGKITAGAKMDKGNIIRYIVGFVTLPGEFLIEAEIDFFVSNKTFSDMSNVQRASKINQNHVKCVTDPKTELFCYCKDAS